MAFDVSDSSTQHLKAIAEDLDDSVECKWINVQKYEFVNEFYSTTKQSGCNQTF